MHIWNSQCLMKKKQVWSTNRCVLSTFSLNLIHRETDGPTDIPYLMQFYISAMFVDFPDEIHKEKPSFLDFENNWLPTDGRTDGRTDRPSYRDARTHLKQTVALCAYTCVNIHLCVCAYVRTYRRAYVHAFVCMCDAHIQACVRKYLRAYVRAYEQRCSWRQQLVNRSELDYFPSQSRPRTKWDIVTY